MQPVMTSRVLTIFVALISVAMSMEIDASGIYNDFSPENAKQFCQEIAYGYSIQRPDFKFLKAIQEKPRPSMHELAASLESSPNAFEEIGFIFSIGDESLVSSLWAIIENQMERNPELEWEWSLPAIAVMCSNDETAEFVFGKGFSPNQYQEGVSDFMITAIVNHDLEMARILFESGYTQCDRRSGRNNETLDKLAERLNFQEFLPLLNEYCMADGD